MSHLFAPLALRSVTLANRIAVSPMCQYFCTMAVVARQNTAVLALVKSRVLLGDLSISLFFASSQAAARRQPPQASGN